MSDTRLDLPETEGTLRDLREKLNGGQGEEWLRGLKKFLRKENPWVWKTIEIGIHKNAWFLCEELRGSGVRISFSTNELNNAVFSTVENSVNLVLVSVWDLGFHKGGQLRHIYEAAERRGWYKCSVETGLELRRQYRNQPKLEKLVIAMDPIIDSSGDPYLLYLNHDLNLWLGRSGGNLLGEWSPPTLFVFVTR
jgi:hypothetical protein